jgi:hypothetical protein
MEEDGEDCFHFFVSNAFISQVSTQTESIIHRSIAEKNLSPWRDSNPDLLFMRRMRCPLRQAATQGKIGHVFMDSPNS